MALTRTAGGAHMMLGALFAVVALPRWTAIGRADELPV